jgi:hypothetical protein
MNDDEEYLENENPIQNDSYNTIQKVGYEESYEIKDNSTRGKVLIYVFWGLIIFSILHIIYSFFEYRSLVNNDLTTVFDSYSSITPIVYAVIAISQFILLITSIVVFIMWFRRAYGNLHRMGISKLEYNEPMAFWSWIIPFVFLVVPVKIMMEICAKTQENVKKLNPKFKIENINFAITLWWIFFLGTHFLERILFTGFELAETRNELINEARTYMITDSLTVIEAFIVIFIVTKISKVEDMLKEEVKQRLGVVM